MSSQSPRGQGNDDGVRANHQHDETTYTDSYVETSEAEDADPNITSLVEEYLSTVRVHRTISGQPAALPQPSHPRPQPVEPASPSEPGTSEAAPVREGGNRRREAEQELANLRRQANTLVQAKQYDEALAIFQRLYMIAGGNNDDSALYWMGECEYHLGNLTRAKDLLEQYLAVRDGNVDRSILARLTVIRRNLAAQNRHAGTTHRKPFTFRRNGI